MEHDTAVPRASVRVENSGVMKWQGVEATEAQNEAQEKKQSIPTGYGMGRRTLADMASLPVTAVVRRGPGSHRRT